MHLFESKICNIFDLLNQRCCRQFDYQYIPTDGSIHLLLLAVVGAVGTVVVVVVLCYRWCS